MLVAQYPKINQLQLLVILFYCIYSNMQLSGLHLLLKAAKRDAWISVILTTAIYILYVLCLLIIIRRLSVSIPFGSWLEEKVGKVAARIVMFPFAIYTLISAYMSLRDVMVFTNVNFLTYTPAYFTTLVFIILCLYLARSGIRSIAICASVLVINTLLLFVVLEILENIHSGHFNLFLPIVSEGWSPILKSSVSMGQALVDTLFMLILVHHTKENVSTKYTMIFSNIVCLLILASVMGSIMSFGGYEAAELRYPYFQQWRVVRVATYLEHLDVFTLIQVLSASLIKISVSLFMLTNLFKQQKQRKWIMDVTAAALFVCTLLPFSDMKYLHWLRAYFYPASIAFSLIFMIIILLTSFKKRRFSNSEN